MGGDRGQGGRGDQRRRDRRDGDWIVDKGQRLADRRGADDVESGAGGESGGMGGPVEAGQDSADRDFDSRRAGRGESGRYQDERRKRKSREGDRVVAVDHGADYFASVSVEGAEGGRMAGGGDGDCGSDGARTVPEVARSG